MRAQTPCFLGLTLVLGCGTSTESANQPADRPLDCGWFEGDNCWKVTAASAQSCLPPSDTSGTFSPDYATCTYASGQVVTFTPALTFPFEDPENWDFTITSADQLCVHLQNTAAGSVSLTTGSDTFTVTQLGPVGAVRFTCPDGTRYESSSASAPELATCARTNSPGYNASIRIAPSSIRFSLNGTSSPSPHQQLFYCIKP